MNSVAPSTVAGRPAPLAEADLVRAAARGDSASFSEIYNRHRGPAWRLAQALTSDTEAARAVFCDGFVRAVRSGRGRRPTGSFGLQVLAAVYRAAADEAFSRPPSAPRPRRSASGQAALAEAAFRSLPERWRAGIWLSDVEGMDDEQMAAVLGVSAGVAHQLLVRGRRGLAGRFAQAHAEMPDPVGPVLAQTAPPPPADLAAACTARWCAAGPERSSGLEPLTSWLDEHGARPLSVATGALIGLGLIGFGVVGGGGPVRAQLGAAGTGSVTGAVPVAACVGPNCAAAGGASANPAGTFTAAFDRVLGFGGGTATAAAATTAATVGATAPVTSTGPGSTGTEPGSGTGPGNATVPGTGSTIPPAGSTATVTLPLDLGTVTLSGGSVSTSVGGGSASASAGSCGVAVSAGSATVSTCSGGTSSGSGAVSSVANSVSSTVKAVGGSVVKTVTGGVSSVTSGGSGSSSGGLPAGL